MITFQWLEALGLCDPGGAGPFVEAGNTRLGGSLPVNTDGGACNVGRRHGANFCIEATRQLRGECGERQVEGAEVVGVHHRRRPLRQLRPLDEGVTAESCAEYNFVIPSEARWGCRPEGRRSR